MKLTEIEKKILSISEKLSKAEGVFTGCYYSALMTGKKDAATTAFDMRRDVRIALNQAIEIANHKIQETEERS